MAGYTYSAMDGNGHKVRGRMDASNVQDLEKRLARMDLDLIDCRAKAQGRFGFGSKRVSRRDLTSLCFQLQQLASAGVPLLEGLADIRDTAAEHPRLRAVVADLIESIESGKYLSQAMAQHPKLFDEVFVSLVHAGEQSGQLPIVFQHLTDALKWQDELISQTKQVITYPLVVGVVVLGVMYFLMTWLVPQLMPFLIEMGGVIPWYTRMLIAISKAFTDYGFIIVGAPVAVVAGVLSLARVCRPVRYTLDRFKLSLWLVGPVQRDIILSRFASFFALMYASGVTVLDGLKLAEKVMGNLAMEDGVDRAWTQISNGEKVSEAFAAVGMFPPLVVRMVRVGEATGQLDSALANVSYFYTREVRESIGRIQTLLPIIMTVLLGGMVALVMISVLGPIYDTISKLQM